MKYTHTIQDIKIETDILGDEKFTKILVDRLNKEEWEIEEAKFIHLIDKNSKVLELGGCLGFISCLVNKQLSNPTQHIVLEANPELIPYLTHNRDINNCSFIIENKVLHQKNDTLNFNVDKRSILGSNLKGLPEGRTKIVYKIPSVTLSNLETQLQNKFDVLICDIEGGEYELINNVFTNEFLNQLKFISIEFHSNLDNKFVNNLKDLEFKVTTFKAAQGQTQLVAYKH